MATYVVQVDGSDDLVVEDPALQLELRPGWAVFGDETGVALAIPAECIRGVQRLDKTADPSADGS